MLPTPVLNPRTRRREGCGGAPVTPNLDHADATALAGVVKALADPTRLRLVDAVRKAAPEAVCQCELVPLFAMSQPALAKHLKQLVTAGVLGSERQGLWTYYFVAPGGTDALTQWLRAR